MDDGPLALLREVLREPAADGREVGDVARRRRLPEARPAPHLALVEAARADERGERRSGDVGGVDLDQRLDEVLDRGATLVLVRLEQRRQDVGDDVAVEVLHHVERLAEGVLLAERDDPRHAHAEPGERQLQAGLAEHVVRRGRQRRPRRATEHEPRPVPLDEEGDVRAAGPDPAHRGRARRRAPARRRSARRPRGRAAAGRGARPPRRRSRRRPRPRAGQSRAHLPTRSGCDVGSEPGRLMV